MIFSLRSLTSTVILGGLVALTSWFAVRSSEQDVPKQPTSVVPNGVAKQATVWQYTPEGRLLYQGTADKVIQYSDDSTRLVTVHGTYYPDTGAPAWTGNAEQALIAPDNQWIRLQGHVLLQRPQAPHYLPFQLQTSELLLYPQSNSAYTDKPVTLSQTGSGNVTHAVGLKATLNPKVIELLSKVDSLYETAQHPNTLLAH